MILYKTSRESEGERRQAHVLNFIAHFERENPSWADRTLNDSADLVSFLLWRPKLSSSLFIISSHRLPTICRHCGEHKATTMDTETTGAAPLSLLIPVVLLLHRTCYASSKTHLPQGTHAKLVKRDGKPWKESAGSAPCQKCTQRAFFFFSPSLSFAHRDNWISRLCGFSIKRLEKLSATRHHLLRLCWLCFLSSAAVPDKPSEGLSACPPAWGNGRAELQKDAAEPNKVQITGGSAKRRRTLSCTSTLRIDRKRQRLPGFASTLISLATAHCQPRSHWLPVSSW